MTTPPQPSSLVFQAATQLSIQVAISPYDIEVQEHRIGTIKVSKISYHFRRISLQRNLHHPLLDESLSPHRLTPPPIIEVIPQDVLLRSLPRFNRHSLPAHRSLGQMRNLLSRLPDQHLSMYARLPPRSSPRLVHHCQIPRKRLRFHPTRR